MPDVAKQPEENFGKSLLIHVLLITGVFGETYSSSPSNLNKSEYILRVNSAPGAEAVLLCGR